MPKQKLIEILNSYADDVFEDRMDAQKMAISRGRCGSPFAYKVVEVAPEHFLVVDHIRAPLFQRLLEAANG